MIEFRFKFQDDIFIMYIAPYKKFHPKLLYQIIASNLINQLLHGYDITLEQAVEALKPAVFQLIKIPHFNEDSIAHIIFYLNKYLETSKENTNIMVIKLDNNYHWIEQEMDEQNMKSINSSLSKLESDQLRDGINEDLPF